MKSIQHLAIIMDGNGRWAQQQGLERKKGHAKGAEVLKDITLFCLEKKIPVLTLFAFSTENWKRPVEEVNFLMSMLEKFLKKELKTYLKYQIRFQVIGNLKRFSPSLQQLIQHCVEMTKHHTALTQVLALNYGARDEIVRAIQKIPLEKQSTLTEEEFSTYLDTSPLPDVDLIIRTSGEERISNFLLWQIAYAEFYFTPVLWPDFTPQHLAAAIEDFEQRKRRFGGVLDA